MGKPTNTKDLPAIRQQLKVGKLRDFRDALAKLGGKDSEIWLARLEALSAGEAVTLRLPDGREQEPIAPSLELQFHATVKLLEYARGKPVSQSEALELERREQVEDAAAKALSASDLEARAAEILQRRLSSQGATKLIGGSHTVVPEQEAE